MGSAFTFGGTVFTGLLWVALLISASVFTAEDHAQMGSPESTCLIESVSAEICTGRNGKATWEGTHYTVEVTSNECPGETLSYNEPHNCFVDPKPEFKEENVGQTMSCYVSCAHSLFAEEEFGLSGTATGLWIGFVSAFVVFLLFLYWFFKE